MRRTTSLIFAFAVTLTSSGAAAAASFNSVVETVLSKQPQITDLSADRRREMIACVQKVLEQVPPPKRDYVAQAKNYDEMENRFGEVVMADRARFKQRITRECGNIVASQ